MTTYLKLKYYLNHLYILLGLKKEKKNLFPYTFKNRRNGVAISET